MALVKNLGGRQRPHNLEAERRVKVLVECRAQNSTFHGVRLNEGENVLVIPTSILHELQSQVEDADWSPVVTRYEQRMRKECYAANGDKIREEEQSVYNMSAAFVEQYLREPRRFLRVEVLEENIEPDLSPRDAVTMALMDKLSAVPQSGRKGREQKQASSSTE